MFSIFLDMLVLKFVILYNVCTLEITCVWIKCYHLIAILTCLRLISRYSIVGQGWSAVPIT